MKNKIFALISVILMLSSLTACKKDETNEKIPKEELSSLIVAGNLSSDDGSLKFSASTNFQDKETGDSVLILNLESDDEDVVRAFNTMVKLGATDKWEEAKENRKRYGKEAVGQYILTPVPSIDENFVQTFYEKYVYVPFGDLKSTTLMSVNLDIKTKQLLFVDDALALDKNTPDGVTSAVSAESYVNKTYPETAEGREIAELADGFQKIDLQAFMLPCEVTDNRTLLYFYVEYFVDEGTGNSQKVEAFLVYDVTNGTMKLYEEDENHQYNWFK